MKKTFKKLVAVTTGLVLALGMSVGVAAADTDFDLLYKGYSPSPSPTPSHSITLDDDTKGSSTRNVTVKCVTDDTTKVYRVDVTWDSLEFTYSFEDASGNKGTWNPDTHTYDIANPKGWDKSSASIKVTNHSNAPVAYSATLSVTSKNGVTAALEDSESNLATAVGTTVSGAPSGSITLKIDGKPAEAAFSDTNSFTFGTVTVAISRYTGT